MLSSNSSHTNTWQVRVKNGRLDFVDLVGNQSMRKKNTEFKTSLMLSYQLHLVKPTYYRNHRTNIYRGEAMAVHFTVETFRRDCLDCIRIKITLLHDLLCFISVLLRKTIESFKLFSHHLNTTISFH